MSHAQQYISIDRAISEKTAKAYQSKTRSSVIGGCINQASKIEGHDGRIYFLKQNNLKFLPFFEAEARALMEIEETGTIQVPQVIVFGETEGKSFLILEFMEQGSSSKAGQKQLGRELAQLHQVEKPFFGWDIDNCIGATPQPNPKSENWVDFYRTHRLIHQFELAKQKGKRFDQVETLLTGLDFFFADYIPTPSLLHGDLWGGNASYDAKGSPFIFDPATYYGDRETDLAFTYMFGGFSSDFYQAYQETYPLDSGFTERKILYNLYHELNHFNLFGGGYANSAQSSINTLVHHLP